MIRAHSVTLWVQAPEAGLVPVLEGDSQGVLLVGADSLSWSKTNCLPLPGAFPLG